MQILYLNLWYYPELKAEQLKGKTILAFQTYSYSADGQNLKSEEIPRRKYDIV